MVRIKFNKEIVAEVQTDICCFSGHCHSHRWRFLEGQEFICHKIFSEGKKTSTLVLMNKNKDMLHPDRVIGVPTKSFEVLEES